MKLIKKINKPKVLIYDDENIRYIVGDLATFDHEPQKEGRVKKLKEFVANIYNINLDEDDENYDWD